MGKQKLTVLLQVMTSLLVLLWVYTATSKLIDLNAFEKQLGKQNFNQSMVSFLLWAIPIAELATVTLLVNVKTRQLGLICSLLLMILFTGYIGLGLAGFYDKVPCSCGGVLKNMGWQTHFWFNIFFLAISGFGIWLQKMQTKLANLQS